MVERTALLHDLVPVAEQLLESPNGPQVWISITGHGRRDGGGQRVAFGDDAAVAGGLVVWDERGPCFCADAIADPVTGVTAATAALTALNTGRRWLLDIAMSDVAADLAGPTLDATPAPRASAERRTCP